MQYSDASLILLWQKGDEKAFDCLYKRYVLYLINIAIKKTNLELVTAVPDFCTDNAAMIAFAALLRHLAGESSPLDEDIHPNLPLVSI